MMYICCVCFVFFVTRTYRNARGAITQLIAAAVCDVWLCYTRVSKSVCTYIHINMCSHTGTHLSAHAVNFRFQFSATAIKKHINVFRKQVLYTTNTRRVYAFLTHKLCEEPNEKSSGTLEPRKTCYDGLPTARVPCRVVPNMTRKLIVTYTIVNLGRVE